MTIYGVRSKTIKANPSFYSATANALEEDVISSLPLSNRAINCLTRAGISSLDDLMALNAQALQRIPNLGQKTCQEILAYCAKLQLSELHLTKKYYLEDMSADNKSIPVNLLSVLGVSDDGIDYLLKHGKTTCHDLGEQGLSPREFSIIRSTREYLSTSVIEHFIQGLEQLKEKEKISLYERIDGATLQEIGDQIGVSRERVRQLLLNANHKLKTAAVLIAGKLLADNGSFFAVSDLEKVFPTEQTWKCCQQVLLSSDYVMYCHFADKFIRADYSLEEMERRLAELTHEVIGNGTNFYHHLELVELELQKRELDYLNFEDYMNYLIQNGYQFYGDYVIKRNQSYALVCYDAVCHFFDFDIKLNSDENNMDMHKLRQIMNKHYSGLSLPANNRALTSALTRDASKMVLSGRGRYCPIEKVKFNVQLLDEVVDFVHKSEQTSFYYSEIFAQFKERFSAETNILNHHFLHGILKCLYPEEFIYERDLFVKTGELRQDINDRIESLLLKQGRTMTKAQIKEAIPGINDFVIVFSVMRSSKVIQWNDNEFQHIDNIDANGDDVQALRGIINALLYDHQGYTSDVLLYQAARVSIKQFLTKNNIQNAQNLYYTASYLLGSEFRFRRPHITTLDFPVQDLNSANVARYLLPAATYLNYEQFSQFAERAGWSIGTTYVVFLNLEKDYMRLSENDYIRQDCFDVPQGFLNSLRETLGALVQDSGYCALNSIFDYEQFPNCKYEWNGFLLESLIAEYALGFRVITPQVKDRRYQKGIIVQDDSPYLNLADLVVGVLKKDGIQTITPAKLHSFLKKRGIITTVFPSELYECQSLIYKNEAFKVK